MTEPGAGSDVAGLKTRAEKKGDEVIFKFYICVSFVSFSCTIILFMLKDFALPHH